MQSFINHSLRSILTSFYSIIIFEIEVFFCHIAFVAHFSHLEATHTVLIKHISLNMSSLTCANFVSCVNIRRDVSVFVPLFH